MAKVFISYRRSESLKDATRIYDHLSAHLPAANVFKDVHTISKGDEFRTVIEKTLSTTDAVLVLIGPKWLSLRMGNGTRRLHDPGDYVRLEVQIALGHPDCLVIPVFLNHAGMPNEAELPDALKTLTHLNAVVVRDDPDFLADMQVIVEQIQRHCGEDITPSLSDSPQNEQISTDSNVS